MNTVQNAGVIMNSNNTLLHGIPQLTNVILLCMHAQTNRSQLFLRTKRATLGTSAAILWTQTNWMLQNIQWSIKKLYQHRIKPTQVEMGRYIVLAILMGKNRSRLKLEQCKCQGRSRLWKKIHVLSKLIALLVLPQNNAQMMFSNMLYQIPHNKQLIHTTNTTLYHINRNCTLWQDDSKTRTNTSHVISK